MKDPKLEIIVIDDNIKQTDPLIVQLKMHFPNYEIKLHKNAKEGLEYILSNINRKMILLLDYDLGADEMNGTKMLLKIREKTALLFVIIITAKLIDDIPNKELVEFINKDALAVIDKTTSMEEKIEIIEKAIHSLNVKVDSMLEQWILSRSDKKQNEPYLTTNTGEILKLKDILKEIRLQTEFGRKMERNILMLAIDLLTREKKTVNND